MNLDYEKSNGFHDSGDYESEYLESEIYQITSMYSNDIIRDDFINLKANIVDVNPAMIVKSIQGTDQDFLVLMSKAKDFLNMQFHGSGATRSILLDLFQECVFGFYVLTPLIAAPDVSDIKVYSWNNITCKSNGKRYKTDISFMNEDDYDKWFERFLRIHRLHMDEENSLQHCTDRKSSDAFLMRIDVQLKYIVSTQTNNLHIRKIPKVKYSWDYLKEAGMVTDELIEYLRDRIASGYGFLISGRGGSGKSTLLNNMIDLIPFDESILVSQESDELYSDNHPQIQFEHTMDIVKTGQKISYSLEDELRLGLLQDIDNFVIGEIKGGEALYCFTTAMSTGARFFGTIHSNNAAGSVRRLAQCARYVSDYPMEALEEMLTATPFALIHMSRFSIDEILEIEGWDYRKSQLNYRCVYDKAKELRMAGSLSATVAESEKHPEGGQNA